MERSPTTLVGRTGHRSVTNLFVVTYKCSADNGQFILVANNIHSCAVAV